MAEKLLMLALSPTMEEGTIVSWQKKEGDSISSGDILCEVETDKATMEYESIQEGTLLKIAVPEGGQAVVGQPIGIVGTPDEDISALEKEIQTELDSKGGGSDAEKPKDNAEEKKETGSPQDSGKSHEENKEPSKEPQAVTPPAPPAHSGGQRVLASPLARVLAEETGIDLGTVKGSGPSGRITKKDVEDAAKHPEHHRQRYAPSIGAPQASVSKPGEDTVIPLNNMRKTIARRLSESKYSAPHFYLKVDVRGEGLVQARSLLNKRRKEGKVSVNAFLIKYAAEALKRYPGVNAGWKEDSIVQFGSIDIGLAVAIPNGLITPVVRNCGNKGVEQIDRELSELISKAQEGKLAPEEYSGATFSISNLGSFGIDDFTAIINPPGSAILAVGALKNTPVADDSGTLTAGKVMKFSLSCDHRVIDGALGAGFLKTLKEFIENPAQMIY